MREEPMKMEIHSAPRDHHWSVSDPSSAEETFSKSAFMQDTLAMFIVDMMKALPKKACLSEGACHGATSDPMSSFGMPGNECVRGTGPRTDGTMTHVVRSPELAEEEPSRRTQLDEAEMSVCPQEQVESVQCGLFVNLVEL